MTIIEANKIVQIWARHLEFTHAKLVRVFLSSIPQSLLPYPTQQMEEAFNIMGEYYLNQGDKDGERLMKESVSYLLRYVDDEKALFQAAANYSDEKLREVILDNLDCSDITKIQEEGLPK